MREFDLENFLGRAQSLPRPHALIVNGKCGVRLDDSADVDAALPSWAGRESPVCLVHANANVGRLPPDAVLDRFDMVFKREPYRDRDRYSCSPANRKKLRATVLSSPLPLRYFGRWEPVAPTLAATPPFRHDIFFSGKTTHPIRAEALERLKHAGVGFYGGLHEGRGRQPTISFPFNSMTMTRYREAAENMAINLVLRGIGEYTYRHQELLYLSSFLLSDPSVRELEVWLPLEEGVHWVLFEDLDDMVEKIRYYLTHEEERARIAQAGGRLFAEWYDCDRYGSFIGSCLDELGA